MRHIIFEQNTSYPIALLSKGSAFQEKDLRETYITPLREAGVQTKDVIAFTLDYNEAGKAPAGWIKEYLGNLLPALDSLGVKKLICTDAAFFKVLCGKGKAEPFSGYMVQCTVKGYEHLDVVLGINYQQLIYNPELISKVKMCVETLASAVKGTYTMLGSGIIHSAQYPEGVQAIAAALESLHQYPYLGGDIEAFSLRFDQAGIGTIAFAWDHHNGMAFPVDYRRVVFDDGRMCPNTPPESAGSHAGYGLANPEIRALLKRFFETYKGNITWHGSGYDVKVLIYTLWMKDALDTEGLLEGLEVMTRNMDDTKVIAYLAVNSCAGNHLGLKTLAHEFAGNWAVEEIADIRKIPQAKLLQYNLVDALSTNYVKDKYWPIMVADQQLDLYQGLMKDSMKLLLQTELSGLPLSMPKVKEARAKLEAIQNEQLDVIHGSGLIKMLNLLLRDTKWEKDYEFRKGKAKNPGKILPKNKSAFDGEKFNPNSPQQLQRLLYEQMGLPVIDKTDTGQPATGADTIKKLINHVSEPGYKELLQALISYGEVAIILNTFIPAFEDSLLKNDGRYWLHGSFILGGTKSGRLSSKEPNLQNIPARESSDDKVSYAHLVKECFAAPPGWLFVGADFNSLEDYISALTTKDPNKLDVYVKGFDGHCLRAAYYFRDQLGHIDLADPASVNSIKKTHPVLRQDSKAPTFALTYQGTAYTLQKNLGWEKDKAERIEANFKSLYQVSIKYVDARLEQASRDGFVELAFGLRLRTPLIKQVVWGNRKTPREAAAEGRTAGNALGQSYGLLNNRAAAAFMKKARASKYRLQIKPVALIHDAIYLVIEDDLEVLEWTNNNLIGEMRWQELPELYHPTVKLGAALDIFWPSWANKITLPNDADQATLIQVCKAAREKVLEAA